MTEPFFPQKTISKMQSLGLSETDVLDTFHSGIQKVLPSGALAMVKKYPNVGYEIGVMYTQNDRTGEYIILAVWKNPRR